MDKYRKLLISLVLFILILITIEIEFPLLAVISLGTGIIMLSFIDGNEMENDNKAKNKNNLLAYSALALFILAIFFTYYQWGNYEKLAFLTNTLTIFSLVITYIQIELKVKEQKKVKELENESFRKEKEDAKESIKVLGKAVSDYRDKLAEGEFYETSKLTNAILDITQYKYLIKKDQYVFSNNIKSASDNINNINRIDEVYRNIIQASQLLAENLNNYTG